MKKTCLKAFTLLFTATILASCCTISQPIAATSNPVGTKCGKTESKIYLYMFGKNGKNVGIQQCAKKAGISKISHVDSYVKNSLFGLIQTRTVKVYGE